MEDYQKEVIKDLNKQLGNDLSNLDKCYEIRNKYAKRVTDLENILQFQNKDTDLYKGVKYLENNIKDIDKVTKKFDSISEEVSNYLEDSNKTRTKLETYLKQITTLESTLQYMKVIVNIDNLNTELKHYLAIKDDEQCVTIYANLCDISRSLWESPVKHLKTFLKDSIQHWHNLLKEKFSNEFEEVLKSIKWPFVNTNFSLITPSTQNIQKLELLCEYLLQIQIPEELPTTPIVTSALLSDFPPLSLPMTLMVRPLRKRFMYHFYGTRQTNRIDKPEWYFTQILSWIRDHSKFVNDWIQPVVDKLGLIHIDARVELMRGLVQLAVEKLCAELPTIQYDDFTFSHCVDEALGFDRELRENYDYPTNQPSVLAVLTQAAVFMKWLVLEKKYALEKMDSALSSNDAFSLLASDEDDLKITVCADMFVTLLQTITERYEALPQPGHRLQFLDLQLELLDDFRIRLLQLHHMEINDPVESRLPYIANIVNYIENILLDWGTTVHYLHLYHYKNQFDELHSRKNSTNEPPESLDEDNFAFGTVFDETISLYKHMRVDLVNQICEAVVYDVKARSRSYRNDRWASMPVHKDVRSLSLTTSACPMFEILATRLHQVEKCLASQLFRTFWHSVAEKLDAYFYDELILENRFNEGGSIQLKYDVTRNLFPLFAQYTEKPDTYFTKLHESCNLLNLAKGSALLLRETIIGLEGATGVEDRRGKILSEMGVDSFSPKQALAIINLRTDIVSLEDNVLNLM